MKVFPRLLSSLLVASVALLYGGVVWTANKSQSKAAAKVVVKRAPLANGKAKRLAKAQAPIPVELPSVASVPAAVESSPAKPNPYLPGVAAGAAAATASLANPYLPSVPAVSPMPLAMTNSLSSVPIAAKVEPVAVKMQPVVAKAPEQPVAAPPAAVVATPLAAKVAPEAAAEKTPPAPARDIASEQAWAKIAANPAVAPRQAAPVVPAAAPTSGNPYLAYRVAYAPAAAPAAPLARVAPLAAPAADASGLINSLRNFLPEPHLPSPDIDVLPSITKVYPTGDRPMYVLTFKCPTELVGITPPPTKALRWLITSGMEAVNSTNLLPFSMQQVCQ